MPFLALSYLRSNPDVQLGHVEAGDFIDVFSRRDHTDEFWAGPGHGFGFIWCTNRDEVFGRANLLEPVKGPTPEDGADPGDLPTLHLRRWKLDIAQAPDDSVWRIYRSYDHPAAWKVDWATLRGLRIDKS